MKTDLFQSCGHCLVFQICRHIECSTFTASYFNRIWNSLAGIPSSPLGLFIVMLPKAHLTLHSRGVFSSRWVITPSWLSRSLFIVMLPKAHLTLHSRSVFSSRWVITPSWLSRSLRPLFVKFCVFLLPFLNIFCFCWVHTISILYCAHLCMKCSFGISNV